MGETFERVKAIVAGHLGIDAGKVTEDASFRDLGADELDRIEIVLAVEEAFDCYIDDDAIETFATAGDVIRYLEQRDGQGRGAKAAG